MHTQQRMHARTHVYMPPATSFLGHAVLSSRTFLFIPLIALQAHLNSLTSPKSPSTAPNVQCAMIHSGGAAAPSCCYLQAKALELCTKQLQEEHLPKKISSASLPGMPSLTNTLPPPPAGSAQKQSVVPNGGGEHTTIMNSRGPPRVHTHSLPHPLAPH